MGRVEFRFTPLALLPSQQSLESLSQDGVSVFCEKLGIPKENQVSELKKYIYIGKEVVLLPAGDCLREGSQRGPQEVAGGAGTEARL